MRLSRRAVSFAGAALFGVALIAGCGGGSSSGGSAPSVAPLQPMSNTARVDVAVTIVRSPSAKARAPQYVSPATQSMAVSVSAGGGTPITATANCPPPQTSCAVSVLAPVGQDSFAVTLYSQPNATGSVLSSGAAPATVVAGITNKIAIALGGQIASIAVSAASATLKAGVAGTDAITVSAFDASGALIAGSAPYASPIALTNSDTSGATTLSPSTVTAPGSPVSLAYNGAAALAGKTVTITASAAGVPASAVTPAAIVIGSAAAVPVASPAAVSFGASTDPAQTVTVTESGFTGAFTESDTCGTGSTAIATIKATTQSPGSQSYSVTPGTTAGSCIMSVSDGLGGKVQVPISLTTTTFPIN